MGKLALEVLSSAELERLHKASLHVLEKTGVRVMHEPMRRILAAAGALTDDTDIVRFPAPLVEELLLLAPREVRFVTMKGETLHIGGSHRYYASVVMDPKVIDYEQGPRPPVLEDVRRLTILGDALPRVSCMSLMEYPPADVPGPLGYLRCLEVFATHMTRHMMVLPTSLETMWQRVELAEILADGAPLRDKPVISLAATMTSPLRLTGVNADIMLAAVERGIPLLPVVCPMAGTTAPYSLAGTTVIGNVESLFIIIATQALKPGHPVIYGFDPSLTDMRSGGDRYYTPDKFLFRLAATQMGNYYRLPQRGVFCGTMVGRFDPQNGMENVLFALADLSGRQHLNSSLGSCFNANGVSEEQVLIDDTLAAMVERLCEGMEVDDAHIGLEAIHNVGPGGHYLVEPMTRRFLRSDEFFAGGLLDLTGEGHAEDALLHKAHAKVQEIVASHKPAVPEHTVAAVQRFIREQAAKIA